MKKIIYYLLLICSLCLICGCAIKDKDKAHAKDPSKFVLDSLKEKYDLDGEIISQGSKKVNGIEYQIFTVKEISTGLVFNASTFWFGDPKEETSTYEFETNYESFANKVLLEEYFENNKQYKLVAELGEVSVDSYLQDYKFTVQVTDEFYLSQLHQVLYEAQDLAGFFDTSVTIRYKGKEMSVSLQVGEKEKRNPDDLERKITALE